MSTDGSRRIPVIISVDLANQPHEPLTLKAAPLRSRVLDTLQQLRLPVTWVCSHASDTLCESIVNQAPSHEIALLTDLQDSACRNRLHQERHVLSQYDIPLETVALPHGSSQIPDKPTLSYCARQGIRAIRLPITDSPQQLKPVRPNTLRHGICAVGVSFDLAGKRGWSLRSLASRCERQIKRYANYPLPMHLAIHLPPLAERGQSLSAEVDTALATVHELREAGTIDVMPLRHFAAQRLQRHDGRGESILRVA